MNPRREGEEREIFFVFDDDAAAKLLQIDIKEGRFGLMFKPLTK